MSNGNEGREEVNVSNCGDAPGEKQGRGNVLTGRPL
jgi:hypothetical protein